MGGGTMTEPAETQGLPLLAAIAAAVNGGIGGRTGVEGRYPFDENDVVEITSFGDPAPRYLDVGWEKAWATNVSRYVEGSIEVDEFEAETERLLRKKGQR